MGRQRVILEIRGWDKLRLSQYTENHLNSFLRKRYGLSILDKELFLGVVNYLLNFEMLMGRHSQEMALEHALEDLQLYIERLLDHAAGDEESPDIDTITGIRITNAFTDLAELISRDIHDALYNVKIYPHEWISEAEVIGKAFHIVITD